MKANLVICVLLWLTLGTADAQALANPTGTNAPAISTSLIADGDSLLTSERIQELRSKGEKGDAQVQFALGAAYFFGRFVPQDHAEAIKWLRKAAEQDTKALGWESGNCCWYLLGMCHLSGKGVPVDSAQGVQWLGKAAERGVVVAQSMLGALYDEGKLVRRDYAESVKWQQRAANQGDSIAQSLLGFHYADGTGLAINDVEAYKWLSLSVANEVRDDVRIEAKKNLKVVAERMSRQEIVEAQRLASQFKPRKESGSDLSALPENILVPKASGTGFFITENGFLISNEHVVRNSTQIRLVTSAGLISAKVVKVDAANDLALLKAEGKFAALPVATSRAVKLGGTVATVGFPNIGLQGFAPKLAKGEIASLSGAADDARHFQISVPVQPGNSGGALVDERGNVVGVVAAKLSARAALAASGALPENVNYAVKSSFLLGFLESVPEVAAKLREPNTKDRKFEDVVKDAEQAAVLVLVY